MSIYFAPSCLPSTSVNWTAISAAAAVLAFFASAWQIRKYRMRQIEAAARNHYQAYLQLRFEHPEFTDTTESKLDLQNRTFDGSAETFRRYRSFMWVGLNAFESLYGSLGRYNSSWRETIRAVLHGHRRFLTSIHITYYLETVEPKFRKFLKQIITEFRAELQQEANANATKTEEK